MTDPVAIAVFGAAAGAFLAVGAALMVSRVRGQPWWTAILLMLGAAAHAVDWLAWRTTLERGVLWPAWLLSVMTAGLFWAFVRASFQDRPSPVWRLAAPAGVLAVAAVIGAALGRPAATPLWLVYNTAVIAFMGHALWMLAKGWRGDLVEGRRRLRGPIIVAAVVYIILVQAGDLAALMGSAFDLPATLQAGALLALALAAAAMLLTAERALLTPPARPAVPENPLPPAVDPQDRALAARLDRLMVEDEVWRQDDLTIGVLAGKLKVPEHRLRSLINAQLGHRNFAAFVNAHRIDAAKAALADPENGRTPVSTIAFDLGFGSLGPFNRAFKEATGLTPTQWRLQALSASPNSENSGQV